MAGLVVWMAEECDLKIELDVKENTLNKMELIRQSIP